MGVKKRMFGEKPMFGMIERCMDSKGRMAIPSFTHVEQKEELAFTMDDRNFFLINSLRLLKDTLLKLKQSDPDEQLIAELEQRIKFIKENCMGLSIVDNQRRVIIPLFMRDNLIPDEIKSGQEKLLIRGCSDMLKVYVNRSSIINQVR